LGTRSSASPTFGSSFDVAVRIAGKRIGKIQRLGRFGSGKVGVESGLGRHLAELVETEN
jgi:hypothetical protein